MTQSSPGGTPTVRSRLTSMAVTASMLASLMSFTFATPTFASPHSASDFFAFARAEFGGARNGNEQDCDTSNDKQVDVSGSGNDIFGRLHSNADIAATSGATTTFHGAITYGTTEDGDCVEQSEDATNSYLAGQPQDLNADPPGVIAGWPGDLASYLNADGLNFGNDITQVLTGIDPETGLPYVCDIGSLTNVGVIEIDETDDDPGNNGLVVCNGEGQLTKLSTQNQELSITIVSHGPIEISGQGAILRPEAHSILTWTDWPLDVSTKLAGSNLSVPRTAILFAPSGGIDTSGSEDADLCIQLIGQGPIKVPGSSSDFGPGSEACTENVPTPDVSVAKSPDGATINAGQTATFTILVTNSGPGASNVTLSDTLPTAVTWTEVAGSDPSNFCSVSVGSPQVLSCDFGSVPDTAGLNTRTVSISAPTDSSDCGLLDNTVTITPSGDVNVSNNSDDGDITVACPNVSVSKSPDGENVTAGGTATFSILVTNNGPGAASNVMLSDTLPNGGLVWSEVLGSDPSNFCTVSDLPAPQTLTCDFGTVSDQAGQNTRTVSVSSPVDTGDCGPKNNTVTISATGDINALDNTDTGLITVLCPIIRVEKTPDEDANNPSANDISAGENATFTITVHNDGNGVANGVTVFDDLPGLGWSVVAADTTLVGCLVSDPDVGEHAAKGEILTCGPDTLGVGANKAVTVTRDTTVADCGELNNEATAAAANNGNDTDPGNIDVLCPDLDIVKTADDPTVDAGDDIGFSIVVSNSDAAGTGTAEGVTLDDPLPFNTALGVDWTIDAVLFNDVAQTIADFCAIDGSPPAETLECEFGDLAPGDAYEVQLSSGTSVGEEDACTEATLLNEATADADNHAEIDDDATITVQCPDLDIVKTADDPTVDAGDDIGFSIVVSNSDAAGTGTAEGVTLDDPLPFNTALGVDWTIDAVLFNDVAQTIADFCAIDGSPPAETLECEFGDLAPGDAYEVQLSSGTSVGEEDACTEATLLNEATADADNHAEIDDDATITVQCPDLDIVKTADDPTVDAGDDIGFSIVVSNSDAAGTGTAEGVTLDDPLPFNTALGVDWTIDAVLFNDVAQTIADFCAIDGSPPAETLECEFGDLAPGDAYEVQLSSGTSVGEEDACTEATLPNEATADAVNHAEIDDDATITVQCPDLDIVKTADDDFVSAGEQIGFVIEVVNSEAAGTGTADDVIVTDLLPAGDGIDWSVVEVWLNGVPVAPGDIADFCVIDGSPPAETLECEFGDLAPGDSAAVHVTSGTTAASCDTYDNTAVADALNSGEVTSLEATVTVECPSLNLLKQADEDPILAGEEASFTITVWNAGEGDAFDVELHDDLPPGLDWSFEVLQDPDEGTPDAVDCGIASSAVPGEEPTMSLDCDLGTVEPVSMANGIVIRVFADTDRTDCGLLENTAELIDSLLEDPITSGDSIVVQCPIIELEKENDAVGSVLPGTEVTYTLTLTVDDETASVTDSEAEDVVVVDVMPVGLENPTDISDGGTFNPATRTITWILGDLVHGEYTLTYNAIVADNVANGQALINAAAATSPNSQCPDLETLGPECEDESTVIPRVPTLVIDKVANAEQITISGPANAQIATPSIVTWTLSYTLTNGPVTNAVITDVVPAGFTFLDAANGGTLVGGTTVTWNLASPLTTSGSVTFRTTVNVATISRVAPTVNVAVIDSNETEPDQGQDSVTVVVTPPPLGGTPTPLPNTAVAIGIDGVPVTVPIELLVALFIGSLGALAFANVRSRRRL